jgi:hypothetical protein
MGDDEIWLGLTASLGRFDASGQCVADARIYDDIGALGFRAAVTEWNWNGWDFRQRFPQASFREGVPAALGAAGFLHGLMRHPNVAMATQSMMLGSCWGIAAVRVLPDGEVRYSPQAEAVRLHAQHHGSHVLLSRVEGAPLAPSVPSFTTWWPEPGTVSLIDAIATASAEQIFVHLINRDRTRTLPLTICLAQGLRTAGTAEWVVLTGASAEVTTFGEGLLSRRTSTFGSPGADFLIEVPPASVSVVLLDRRQA